MKLVRGAAAIALAFSLHAPAALADDPCCGPLAGADPVVQIQDDDSTDAEVIRELEARLNEVLIVEESGRIVLREEFKEGLPFPADRVQMMLASFVELGPDGKIKVRNPEQVKPYLPMIQRFLSPESMEQLRELQKLPPEQRREAMQRMFGRGQAQPAPTPAPTPKPAPKPEAKPEPTPTPAPAPRRDDEGWDEGSDEGHLHTRPGRDGHFHREPRADHEHGDHEHGDHGHAHPPARSGDLDQRMAQLEHRLERLERALREGQGRHPQADAPRGERRGMLDLFGRGRGERRDVFGDLGRRAEVWRGGLMKLSEIMQPEDFQRLGRTMERLRGQLGSGDLRDRSKLMEKLQDSVDPQDIGRFMEIFSEFIASPEGREFAAELERVIERLEAVVNSEQGQRLGDALERFGEGDTRERMDQLMRGRDARPRDEGRRQAEQPRRGDRGRAQPRVPEGAKLY